MDYLLLAGLSTLILAADLGTAAKVPVERPAIACRSGAYGIDYDSQGSRIRQGPGTDRPILLTAPANVPDPPVHLGLRIAGSTGSWLLVEDIELMPFSKPVFTGPGWMHASLLGTMSRGYDKGYVTLRALPSYRSKVLGTIPSFKSLTLRGCAGQWLKVSYGRLAGWIHNADHCPNPFTTCP